MESEIVVRYRTFSFTCSTCKVVYGAEREMLYKRSTYPFDGNVRQYPKSADSIMGVIPSTKTKLQTFKLNFIFNLTVMILKREAEKYVIYGV